MLVHVLTHNRLNQIFATVFDGRVDAGQPISIRMTLYHTVKWDFWVAFTWGLVQFACMLASPVILREMIAWFGQPCYSYYEGNRSLSNATCVCEASANCLRDYPSAAYSIDDFPLWFSYGIQMALVLFGLNFVTAVAQGQEMYWSRSLGMKMRNSMITATYRKILETSVQSRDRLGTGKVFTLITQDAEIMYLAGYLAARCAVAPFVVAFGTYLAITYAGWAPPICGLGIMFGFVATALGQHAIRVEVPNLILLRQIRCASRLGHLVWHGLLHRTLWLLDVTYKQKQRWPPW